MTQKLIFSYLLFIIFSNLTAQVGINKDGSPPLSLAILHVKGSGQNHFMIEDLSGNVGIGITNPRGILDVYSSITEAKPVFIDNPTRIYLGDVSNQQHNTYFDIRPGDQQFIFRNGNVGIGVSTSPYMLDVNGNAKLGTTASGNGLFVSTGGRVGIGVPNPGVPLEFAMGHGDKIRLFEDGGEIIGTESYGLLLKQTSSEPASHISFHGPGGEVARFDTYQGFLGIGITHPQNPLEVFGEDHYISRLIGDNEEWCGIEIQALNETGQPFVQLNNINYSSYAYHYLNASDHYWGFNINDNDILALTEDGKVGVGTTEPATKLSVANRILFCSTPTPSAPPAGGIVIFVDGNGDLAAMDQYGNVEIIADF